MALTLDPDERWTMLEATPIARVATTRPDGRPHVAPVWYTCHREYDALYFTTPDDSRKARNLRANPAVALTVDEGGTDYFALRAVVCEGEAVPIEDDERAEIERLWCRKYFDQPERPAFMDALYRGRTWVWYRVDPERWTSWNNERIDLDRLGGRE